MDYLGGGGGRRGQRVCPLEKDLSKSEMEELITELDCGITYS